MFGVNLGESNCVYRGERQFVYGQTVILIHHGQQSLVDLTVVESYYSIGASYYLGMFWDVRRKVGLLKCIQEAGACYLMCGCISVVH